MNKVLIILCLVLLTSCGPSQEEKKKVAAVTCSIMSETRNMDSAVRVEKMNEARDKIGGEPFLSGDGAIKEAFQWELCQELVLNETYDESLQSLKDDKQERERIAAEKQRIAAERRAERERIAAEKRAERARLEWEAGAEDRKIAWEAGAEDRKPTVKEEFHPNGQLKSRVNYQSKNDGGEKDGLWESYHENGQLMVKVNYKDGKQDGPYESYKANGELWSTYCLDNGEFVDMSYCEK
jgi:hypothetical protein